MRSVRLEPYGIPLFDSILLITHFYGYLSLEYRNEFLGPQAVGLSAQVSAFFDFHLVNLELPSVLIWKEWVELVPSIVFDHWSHIFLGHYLGISHGLVQKRRK